MTAPSMSADIARAVEVDRRRTSAVLEAAVDQLAHHPGQVLDLLRDSVKVNESGFVVSNVPGLVDNLRASSPYLFRDRQDTDQAKSTAAPAPESVENLSKLFGKNSSSKLANELATTSPRRYNELREAAIKIGLI